MDTTETQKNESNLETEELCHGDVLKNNHLKEKLFKLVDTHPIWDTRLLRSCKLSHLTKADYKLLFEQYYLYSKNFTRYLCALMANMEDDLHRSQLSENIWEEGGGEELEKRHSEIFRKFLADGLGVDTDRVEFQDFSKHFMKDYLSYCMSMPALEGTAFLSLGTEAIVPRLYQIFLHGMKKANIDSSHLLFFELHVECDDEHAETLEKILFSFSGVKDFESRCMSGVKAALDLRCKFFNHLFTYIYQSRVRDKIERINAKKSLFIPGSTENELKFNPGKADNSFKELVYFNKVESRNIEFSVNRAPFKSEVLDARVLTIAPEKTNERHSHAHETIFYVLEGNGKVLVDKKEILVQEGDSVFVPRWCVHQTMNTSKKELKILAVTDFYLTGKALVGNYNSTARMKK